MMLQNAGMNGQLADFEITQNGIRVDADGIKMVLRAPIDNLLENTVLSWSFKGGWGVPTDARTGSAAYFKRAAIIQHARV